MPVPRVIAGNCSMMVNPYLAVAHMQYPLPEFAAIVWTDTGLSSLSEKGVSTGQACCSGLVRLGPLLSF
jgi:hypothetical protein